MKVFTHKCVVCCLVDADLMCDWDLARFHLDRVFGSKLSHEPGFTGERAWTDFQEWYCERQKTSQPLLWLNLSTGASCLFIKRDTEGGHYVPRAEDR